MILTLALALMTVDPVVLARDGKPALSIVAGSDAVRAPAEELRSTLSRIAGGEFKFGDGDRNIGIFVGRPEDFRLPFKAEFGSGPFEREDYVLKSTPGALYLIGATELAVSHAVWDLLGRLGYRQFFPGETWEVVPKTPTLSVALDERCGPSFHSRRIWYNWGLWGYNNEPYRLWCRRNRMAQGFALQSGHSYEAIIAANRKEFDAHPEYYSVNKGRRRTEGGDLKFCISNPDLRRLVAEHAVRSIQANPALDCVSMDPSDGGNWCECAECEALGGVSNRVLTLANQVAVAINALGLGPKYVGIYAYNQHSAPPSIPVHPNVIISATTAFIGGGFTFDQVVDGWKARGATVGVYDYLSVVDWDWNLPRGGAASRPASVADFLVKVHRRGARFYDAESGDCWGPCGLGYYVASRVLWNVAEQEAVPAIVEDFLDKAFGPAKEPMREFYRLITSDVQRRPPSDLVGRMYRQLDAALKAAEDPRIRERLNHLVLYTRHAELYYAYASGSGSLEALARHDYRIRRTMMVHAYGLWSRLLSQKDALTDGHPWKSDAPIAAEDLARILKEGIDRNVPAEPGFSGIEFSRTLVPADPLRLASVPSGHFPEAPQDRQQYFVWVPKDAGRLEVNVQVRKVWANRSPKISLYSPLEVSLKAVAADDTLKPDGQVRKVSLETPYAGLHRVETIDGGDHTHIEWPAGMRVTVESGVDTPTVTSHFRGPWSLVFYVPRGTKVIGGWAARVANWAPRISGTLVDPEGNPALDFAKSEEGWFKVPVPEGRDGKLWRFERNVGQRLLMTVPPYLARSGDELLLPAEVVAADSK